MKRNLPGVLLLLAVLSAFSPSVRANGIATVVVDRAGNLYFSDYIRNRVWKVAPGGALSVWVNGKHTHHLVLDENGALYGEAITPRGLAQGIWEASLDGHVSDLFRAERKGHSANYRGTVFTVDRSGSLLFLRDCQIARLTVDGRLESWAGRRCSGDVWSSDSLRFGHLHGSLAWGPDGSLYFSDARSVRKVAADGTVTTLGGKPVTLFADPQPGEARFDRALGLAVDSSGNVFVADSRDRAVKRVEKNGSTTIVGRLPFLWSPTGLGLSGQTLYVVANLRIPTPGFLAGLIGNPSVFALTPAGKITTVASARGK
ncbi:MAG TPA: SMP-30/gluconolactonase/LRE family protein [Thermoanaerobaculia bacterium]|nr:SMP-30/gluconolactonase/LRE family protein [Thermoanaerobaculia bacterium]